MLEGNQQSLRLLMAVGEIKSTAPLRGRVLHNAAFSKVLLGQGEDCNVVIQTRVLLIDTPFSVSLEGDEMPCMILPVSIYGPHFC